MEGEWIKQIIGTLLAAFLTLITVNFVKYMESLNSEISFGSGVWELYNIGLFALTIVTVMTFLLTAKSYLKYRNVKNRGIRQWCSLIGFVHLFAVAFIAIELMIMELGQYWLLVFLVIISIAYCRKNFKKANALVIEIDFCRRSKKK